MSGLILRSCGRALRRTSHFRAGFTNSRKYTTRSFSFLPKKHLDGIDKIFVGSFLLAASSVGSLYYRSFFDEELSGDHLAKLGEVQVEKTEEEPQDAEITVVVAQPEPKAEPEVLEEAQVERVKQQERWQELEQETTKFKQLASLIATKIDEEIQHLKDKLNGESSAEKKALLVHEMAELKRQVEAFGKNGDEVWQSLLLRKLAMVTGVFAYETAMLNGEPLQSVVMILRGGDPLVDSALSVLPEEAIKEGSWTALQLQSKFYETKPKLRELAVVGPLSHSLAENVTNGSGAKEETLEEKGLEGVFGRVERLLKEGNFSDAADTLEHGFEGTEAQNLATEWAKQARLRAAIEQVHNVLRAYASSISM